MAWKCVQTTVSKAEDLNKLCAALMNKSNGALTKDKCPKPVSRSRRCTTVTSHKREGMNLIDSNRDDKLIR